MPQDNSQNVVNSSDAVNTNEKILIYGRGQIGNLLEEHFKAQSVEVMLADTDITDKIAVAKDFAEFNPTTVINTAAKTNLEFCNDNKLEAFEVNVLGANNIAELADENNAYFIHFSSGCVFQSRTEEDEKFEDTLPEPQSYYSLTKVWSEQIIPFDKSEDFEYLILRPRQPISAKVNPMNMLVKMLTFKKFVDTPNTGTVIEDLLEWISELIPQRVTGVLHVANPGHTTPYQISLLLKKYILPELEPEKISKSELDKLTPNTRVDTVLNVDRLLGLGIEAKPYTQRLEEIIIELGNNIRGADREELSKLLNRTAEVTNQRSVTNDVWQNLLEDSEK